MTSDNQSCTLVMSVVVLLSCESNRTFVSICDMRSLNIGYIYLRQRKIPSAQ